jgi:cell division septation protein DedD
MLAKYDNGNPAALRRLVAGGDQAAAVPHADPRGLLQRSHELYVEISAKNPKFKKIYEQWKPYRSEQSPVVASEPKAASTAFMLMHGAVKVGPFALKLCEKPRFAGFFSAYITPGSAFQKEFSRAISGRSREATRLVGPYRRKM